jgi:hypothetical protein
MQNQRGITVAQIMTHGATHFRDHAAQIRTAAGVA